MQGLSLNDIKLLDKVNELEDKKRAGLDFLENSDDDFEEKKS